MMKLKVYYNVPEGINPDLDQAIAKAVMPFGLIRWASGISLIDGERDLAFDDESHDRKSNVLNIWPHQPDSG